MAVAFVTHAAVTPATGSSFTRTITVSGTNPVLGISIGISSTGGTAVVSSVTWSLGGSLSEIKNLRAVTTTTFGSIWALAAPAAGAGTLTITLSASVPYQADAWVFSGADQTTPCPTGDAVTSGTDDAVLTPTNLTANDATTGLGTNTVLGNAVSVAPNQRYLDLTTAVNLMTGDATGTTSLTFSNEDAPTFFAFVAVRIAAAGAGIGATEYMAATQGLTRTGGMIGRVYR